MIPARRLTALVLLLAALAACAAAAPFIIDGGDGPIQHMSVRGVPVTTYGFGPYRHMPADVAVQGLAQDLVTLVIGIPLLLFTLVWARRGSQAGHLALTGTVGYFLVQYFMYLGMGTYNELFLLWIALVFVAFLLLVKLLLARPAAAFETAMPRGSRRYVGLFLIINGSLMAMLWLQVVVGPLLRGTLYPAGLAHFTTLIVQGYDLALFLPPSLMAGHALLKHRPSGALLAPAYTVFLSLQMVALLAKIVWMSAVGASAGPALIVIPLLLLGAVAAAVLALRSHRGVQFA